MNRLGAWLRDRVKNPFRHHWYRVQLQYKDRAGRTLFTMTTSVGVRQRRTIEDHRKIKQALGPIYFSKGVPRQLLHNGSVSVEPICYLGRWRQAGHI